MPNLNDHISRTKTFHEVPLVSLERAQNSDKNTSALGRVPTITIVSHARDVVANIVIFFLKKLQISGKEGVKMKMKFLKVLISAQEGRKSCSEC